MCLEMIGKFYLFLMFVELCFLLSVSCCLQQKTHDTKKMQTLFFILIFNLNPFWIWNSTLKQFLHSLSCCSLLHFIGIKNVFYHFVPFAWKLKLYTYMRNFERWREFYSVQETLTTRHSFLSSAQCDWKSIFKSKLDLSWMKFKNKKKMYAKTEQRVKGRDWSERARR